MDGCFFLKKVIVFLEHRKIDRRKLLQEIGCLMAGIFIFLVIPKVPQYSSEENGYWSYYWQMNAVRSAIQDYEMPDYATYKEIYEKLGISQNDIYMEILEFGQLCNDIAKRQGDKETTAR